MCTVESPTLPTSLVQIILSSVDRFHCVLFAIDFMNPTPLSQLLRDPSRLLNFSHNNPSICHDCSARLSYSAGRDLSPSNPYNPSMTRPHPLQSTYFPRNCSTIPPAHTIPPTTTLSIRLECHTRLACLVRDVSSSATLQFPRVSSPLPPISCDSLTRFL